MLNGQSGTDFCAYNTECTLSFSYSNFLVATNGTVSGGTLDFYVNSGADEVTEATASSGNLWLSLVANTHATASSGFGKKYATYFDVVDTAGTVFSNFDTNSQFEGTDIGFSGSILASTNGFGAGYFAGNSIPEPTSLAIFGLGLLGLAGAARRRKA